MSQPETKQVLPTWCPGCGNFGILNAFKRAIKESEINPDELVVVGGIGCGAGMPLWMDAFGFATLHGRALPIASGVKRANPRLKVVVVAGDGDTYGIGLGHFIHAVRQDVDVTLLVCNNGVYGLTKGQASPTSAQGQVTPSTPHGLVQAPLNPLALALGAGSGFLARGYAGDIRQLTELIKAGMAHPGFSVIDILQPCVTYNKKFSYDFYNPRVQALEAGTDKTKAWEMVLAQDDRIRTGLFYREERETRVDDPKSDSPGVERIMQKFEV